MGINWLPIENSFPTFLDSESPQAQIKKLHDYMYKLTEQLKYSLANLDTSNWNTAALEKFSEETAVGMVEEVRKFAVTLTQVQATAANLSTRISGVADRLTDTEEEITYLQERLDKTEGNVLGLTRAVSQLQVEAEQQAQEQSVMGESITALQEGQDDLQQRIEEQEAVVQPGEEADTIGTEGRTLNLVGEIYVNGVLLEIGGTQDETA